VTEALAALILLAGAGLVMARWLGPVRDLPALAALTLAVTLLVTPYAFYYDYVLLILPLLLVAARVVRAFSWRRAVLLAALLTWSWSVVIADVWLREWLVVWWGEVEALVGSDGVAELWTALDYYAYGRFFGLLVPLALVLCLWRAPRPRRTDLEP
jgi:hypothetical protein